MNFKADMYKAFLKHCEEFGEKNTTIDRINTYGNYEPSNTRMAIWKVQQNNSKRNHYLTYNGVTKNITQWSEERKINQYVIFSRIHRGWSTERALNN